MMRQFELVERVQAYNPQANEDLLNRAYVYAMQMHGKQKRASGDLYLTHPLEVAGLLLDLKLDDTTIAAALLHDVLEDTRATYDDLEQKFARDIAELVDGVTKLSRLENHNVKAKQAQNFRKLILAISRDIRVVLIKLADRLHNMRTLEYLSEEKRTRIAHETLEIYAPLAGRMGINTFKNELEELAFRALYPKIYADLTAQLQVHFNRSDEMIRQISDNLNTMFATAEIPATIQSRKKTTYSIWNKMQRKGLPLDKLADIMAFRILVDDEDYCYRALGKIHQRWRIVPNRFRDFISLPKPNGYQSLQTTVVLEKGQRVELQIRTHNMHTFAEHGVAAHFLYKEADATTSATASLREAEAYKWIREIIRDLEEGHTPEEFLDHTKLAMFQEQVYCFTRDGDLIALPAKATALDFAYAVHTDLGDCALGCHINGVARPLRSRLESGDEVMILRAEIPQLDSRRLDYVTTARARAMIRRRQRDNDLQQRISVGREWLKRGLIARGLKFDPNTVNALLRRFKLVNENDLYLKVQTGPMPLAAIIGTIEENNSTARITASEPPMIEDDRDFLRWTAPQPPIRMASGVSPDLPVFLSRRAGPLPGDRIVAILGRRGLKIYPIESTLLEPYDGKPNDIWHDVKWDYDAIKSFHFPSLIALIVLNEVGVLARIAATISAQGANISNFTLKDREANVFTMDLEIEVEDLSHLNRILSALNVLNEVSTAEHTRS